MKKAFQSTLIACTVLFFVFVTGVLLGRHSSYAVPIAEKPETETKTIFSDDVEAGIIGGRININTASAETLALLPGVGKSLAQRIIDYRTENGPFIHVEELTKVEGISTNRVTEIADYITVGG